MTNIGIIGVGFMGYTHFEAARKLMGAKVSAIATRNPAKLAGDWTGIQGNFGPRGGHVDLSDVACYSNYQELLSDPNVDLVDVCLPTDMHEKVVLESIAAGKPTLVEKPIAIDPAAAERMVGAAREAGVPLLVGHVLPFFPEFQFAAETIAGGHYGKLRAAHFRRVICPPNWSDGMSDFRTLGGWGIDLHIHDNHFISHICGVPTGVFSRGLLQDDFVNHVHTQYLFDDPDLAVTCVSGGIAAGGLQFAHGFELYLERATVLFGAGTLDGEWVVSQPLRLVTDSEVESPDLGGDQEWCGAFTAELQTAVDAMAAKEEPSVLSGTLALQALRVCCAEAQSIAGGNRIEIPSA